MYSRNNNHGPRGGLSRGSRGVVLQAAGNHGNCDISEAEDFKDDAIQLMTYTINSVPAEEVYGNSGS